jgi:hypothetical protein
MRFGDIVTIPKHSDPEERFVVLNSFNGVVLVSSERNTSFFTREDNCILEEVE